MFTVCIAVLWAAKVFIFIFIFFSIFFRQLRTLLWSYWKCSKITLSCLMWELCLVLTLQEDANVLRSGCISSYILSFDLGYIVALFLFLGYKSVHRSYHQAALLITVLYSTSDIQVEVGLCCFKVICTHSTFYIHDPVVLTLLPSTVTPWQWYIYSTVCAYFICKSWLHSMYI